MCYGEDWTGRQAGNSIVVWWWWWWFRIPSLIVLAESGWCECKSSIAKVLARPDSTSRQGRQGEGLQDVRHHRLAQAACESQVCVYSYEFACEGDLMQGSGLLLLLLLLLCYYYYSLCQPLLAIALLCRVVL